MSNAIAQDLFDPDEFFNKLYVTKFSITVPLSRRMGALYNPF